MLKLRAIDPELPISLDDCVCPIRLLFGNERVFRAFSKLKEISIAIEYLRHFL